MKLSYGPGTTVTLHGLLAVQDPYEHGLMFVILLTPESSDSAWYTYTLRAVPSLYYPYPGGDVEARTDESPKLLGGPFVSRKGVTQFVRRVDYSQRPTCLAISAHLPDFWTGGVTDSGTVHAVGRFELDDQQFAKLLGRGKA